MINKTEFSEKLASALTKNGLEGFISDEAFAKLFQLTERMLEVNEYMNLTAICDLDGIVTKHYADSLTVSKYIPEGASVIDVGCGAGFPTLPLAIARPDIKITALDSTAKRIKYIEETANLLGITNVVSVAARAEELAYAEGFREGYDVACARAVARLNVLTELCMGYVKVGGKFIAMKANAEEEVNEAGEAIRKMGGKLTLADRFPLVSHVDDSSEPRCIVCVEKTEKTPKNYPRNNSQIKKKPL